MSLIAIASLISMINFSQMGLACSYTVCWAYLSARFFNYFNPNILRWARFTTYYLIAFILLFWVQRIFNQRERRIFLRKNQNKEMISFYHKLFRVFHDGIILTHGERIIYKNSQLVKILEINQPKCPPPPP
jgi:hypothetical protein